MLPKIPLRFVAPNFITVSSLGLSFASIIRSSRGDLESAAWCILWCALIDKADGAVARVVQGGSKFGAELDSLADLVAFGLAPAVLVHAALTSAGADTTTSGSAAFATTLFYVLATALRLARFNVLDAPPSSDPNATEATFVGIPSTLSGSIISSGMLVWFSYSRNPFFLRLLPSAMVLFGLLMISSIRIPKIKRHKNRLFNALQLLIAAALALCAILMVFPAFPFGMALGYTVIGIIYCALKPPFTAEPASQESKEGEEQDIAPSASK